MQKKRLDRGVNNELRKLLIDRNVTVTSLAEAIGVSREWLSKVIHGHWPGKPTRVRVAHALGVELKDLWPDNNEKWYA